MKPRLPAIAAFALLAATQAGASDGQAHMEKGQMMSPGLIMPDMNSERGRALFASKGCVVCHSINGVGGQDAPMLDAEFMDAMMNPFDFAARMWRGAGPMVALQQDELGSQIELTGQELADIVAFVHDPEEQKKFTEADIPEGIEAMMHHGDGEETEADDHD